MSKCHTCHERNIIKAYRTICDKCATTAKTPEGKKQLLCTKCGKDTLENDGPGYAEQKVTNKARSEMKQKLETDMEEALQKLKERCKRTVLRKIETGEVTFDPTKKIFVYKDTEEEYKVGDSRDHDDDYDDSDDNSD